MDTPLEVGVMQVNVADSFVRKHYPQTFMLFDNASTRKCAAKNKVKRE